MDLYEEAERILREERRRLCDLRLEVEELTEAVALETRGAPPRRPALRLIQGGRG